MVASERPHGAHGSSGRRPHILLAAEARLRGNPYPALKNVLCGYDQGVLTLRGCLSSYYLKQLAQEAVAEVEGVARIENLIEVITRTIPDSARGRAPGAGRVPSDASEVAPRPPGAAPGQQTAARRVLIVGDQPEVVENWAAAIGGAGHRVRRAGNGAEALALAAQF